MKSLRQIAAAPDSFLTPQYDTLNIEAYLVAPAIVKLRRPRRSMIR
jgi:hypothetical protein